MNKEIPNFIEPQPSSLSRDAFVDRFKHIYEHSPWVPERAHILGITEVEDTAEGLASAFAQVVEAASDEFKIQLIRAHPELAVRPAQEPELTAESRKEQAGAGLDRCNRQEFARFGDLNRAYGEKFGIPFIVAVSGLSVADILEQFEARMGNDPEAEFSEALVQIDKIALIRLRALAQSSS